MRRLSTSGVFAVAAAVVLALAGVSEAANVSIGTVHFWMGGGTAPGISEKAAREALFATPQFCATGTDDNLYVPEWGNDRIRRIKKGLNRPITWVGSLEGNQNGQGLNARINGPSGIAVSNDGSKLFFNEYFNHLIRQVIVFDAVTTTFAGSGFVGTNEGTGTTAELWAPVGLAIRKQTDELFVMESLARRVRKFTNAAVSTTLAGQVNVSGNADGTTTARFQLPSGNDMDQNTDLLWVADQGAHNIRTITQAGLVTTVCGSRTSNAGYVDGTGLDVRFETPFAVAVDPTGTYVFVGEFVTSHVRRINKHTLVTDTVINAAGNNAWSTNDVSYRAEVASVTGLCFDSKHAMYIVGHHSIAYTGTRARSVTQTITAITTPAPPTTTLAPGQTAAPPTPSPPPGFVPPPTTAAPPTRPGNLNAGFSVATMLPAVAALVAVVAGCLLA